LGFFGKFRKAAALEAEATVNCSVMAAVGGGAKNGVQAILDRNRICPPNEATGLPQEIIQKIDLTNLFGGSKG
jgi:hypothetical protein